MGGHTAFSNRRLFDENAQPISVVWTEGKRVEMYAFLKENALTRPKVQHMQMVTRELAATIFYSYLKLVWSRSLKKA